MAMRRKRRHAHRHWMWQDQWGYSWRSQLWNHLFNIAFAGFFLVVTAPLFVVIAIIVLISDGRPIFYSGVRLGRNKRPFTMYKFRTLKSGAENIIGAEILEARHRHGTRHGKFLRDTRLDELPQLFNVIRRDMDLVGPRPIRPVLYDAVCKEIPGYDRRFAVNAGLIGYAQLFTPHGTPKRIRVLIDNALVKQKMKPFCGIDVLAFTAFVLMRTSVQRIFRGIKKRIFARYQEKRALDRRIVDRTAVFTDRTDGEPIGFVKDINEEAFLMIVDQKLPNPLPDDFKLVRTLKVHNRLKTKTARCKVSLFREWQMGNGDLACVFNYSPCTPLMGYHIQQYFLESSFA